VAAPNDFPCSRRASRRCGLASAATLGKLVPVYLKARQADLRPNSYNMTERYLTKHWRMLHGAAIADIKRADVVKVVDEIAEKRGRVAADRARSQLSAFFGWAIDKSYVETNPCMHVRERAPNKGKNRIETKTRALSEAELVKVWEESEANTDFGHITRLLMLTGCRKREISDLLWDETDFEKRQILLPKARTKNKEEFLLPLSKQALDILRKCPAVKDRNGRVFGRFSWSRYKDELDGRLPADFAPWVLHDLRRTFVTLCAENGIASPHIIEACVNHISGHKAGIAGIYNRATYLKEKTEAFAAWANFVDDLLAGRKPQKVVPRPLAA
jgi:integrase